MNDFEETYVKNFYSKNAQFWSNTRYKIWDTLKEYVKTLTTSSSVLELGCGNGKNLVYLKQEGFNDLTGVDNCEELLKICKNSHIISDNIFINADIADSSFTLQKTYDVILCIAVLHHISTVERRQNVIKNIMKHSHHNTKILITVWKSNLNKEILSFTNTLTNTKSQRYIYSFTEEELIELISPFLKIVRIFVSCDNYYIEATI